MRPLFQAAGQTAYTGRVDGLVCVKDEKKQRFIQSLGDTTAAVTEPQPPSDSSTSFISIVTCIFNHCGNNHGTLSGVSVSHRNTCDRFLLARLQYKSLCKGGVNAFVVLEVGNQSFLQSKNGLLGVGNSQYDIPFLEQVGRACVVRPGRKLKGSDSLRTDRRRLLMKSALQLLTRSCATF